MHSSYIQNSGQKSEAPPNPQDWLVKLFRNALGLFHLPSGFKPLSRVFIPLLPRQEGWIILLFLLYSLSLFFNKKTELGFSCTCETSGTTPQSRAIENMPNTSRLGNSKCLPVSVARGMSVCLSQCFWGRMSHPDSPCTYETPMLSALQEETLTFCRKPHPPSLLNISRRQKNLVDLKM